MTGLISFDTLVQAAAVDLFHSNNVAVAPVPRGSQVIRDVSIPESSAEISFSSPAVSGVLWLSVPDELLELMRNDPTRLHRDHVRELTNQLLGRLKSRMLQLDVTLRVGLPSLTSAKIIRQAIDRAEKARLFIFRSLRGDILVAIDGSFDESALKYSGRPEHGSEGDVILF